MSEIAMVRNINETWPDAQPPGTFDVNPCRLSDRPSIAARLFYVCPNRQRCGVFMGPTAEAKRFEKDFYVWAWDGNADCPTLTPSINCVTHDEDRKPTGGCGWHGFVTAGKMVDA